jgi:hypothetical protein
MATILAPVGELSLQNSVSRIFPARLRLNPVNASTVNGQRAPLNPEAQCDFAPGGVTDPNAWLMVKLDVDTPSSRRPGPKASAETSAIFEAWTSRSAPRRTHPADQTASPTSWVTASADDLLCRLPTTILPVMSEVEMLMDLDAYDARDWRTRPDPFSDVWDVELVPLLDTDKKGVLQATALPELLQKRHPGRIPSGQERTLQRSSGS